MKGLNYFHPLVWSILLGTIFTRAASFMTIPFLALYLHNELHATPLVIGVTLGAAQLFATFGGIFGGYLTDKLGRKLVIIFTIFVWSGVFIGFALVQNVLLFIILSSLNGLCRSFFEPATQALMIDFTEKEKRRRLFSIRYTSINIAGVIGPVLGVWISSLSSAVMPFVITGVMYAAYGFVLIGLLNHFEMRQQLASGRQTLPQMLKVVGKDTKLLLLLAGGVLISLGYSQYDSTLPQLVNLSVDEGVKLYSILLVINAAIVLLLQLPISVYTEKISSFKSLSFGMCFFAAGFILFNMASSWALFIIAMIVFSIGEIFAFPMMNAMIEEIAPDTQKATYLGASQLKNLGGFIGPIFGGWLLTHYIGEIYYVMAVIVLLSLVFYKKALSMNKAI
ncbi:MDR family MFS transporter [Ureibacillus chungkukjangi]|uniref:MDR family MFS transporter n=1 Tax=Ureibacillus chungkukjangi TaxID=1202712 RepID=UPI002559C851|nr:MFS transporter [Ureibacillus chungkukjangi]